jgi:alginate O-acetyltransferase complex protein AlgI
MVFSSTLFLFIFLPVFLIIYYLMPVKLKNYWTLLSSFIFYAWGEARFALIILLVLSIDFFIVKQMHEKATKKMKKYLMISSVAMKLGLLVYFKYSNFFIENINSVLSVFGGEDIIWTKIVLPIGISFFTFQSITYTLDIYWGKTKPLNSIWDYMLYILLFPQLIAGPIVRYDDVADQIRDRQANETEENRLQGLYRFVIGLAKKIILANTLGQVADSIINVPIDEVNTMYAWVGILAYSFQLYYDFSGYSDMAIGLGKMIGFKFVENFNNPYASVSITEFWRRWHMTLGTFMKDYLYIPLGGNKVSSNQRLYTNLAIVFVLSGFWHGAGWNFILWGVYHGFFLIMDRIFLAKLLAKFPRAVSVAITFFFTMIGWVFFRIENLKDVFAFIGKLFAFDFEPSTIYVFKDAWWILAVSFFFSFFVLYPKGDFIQQKIFHTEQFNKKQHIVLFTCSIVMLFLCVTFISSSSFNPFIYFRF